MYELTENNPIRTYIATEFQKLNSISVANNKFTDQVKRKGITKSKKINKTIKNKGSIAIKVPETIFLG